nr:PREDICTED: uncharacterized protein LOC103277702 isoform X1 [Anolis carolinensis]|eukprot:XP_016846581.1 PREDICTED: uncharacterized protein LOC103277702 isoform X1 [Anolis carolinensis]
MALADFHYTTGISSGFKVYILEGQPSYENEQRFRRLPAHRLPVYPIKRKLAVDGRRSPDLTLERQKLLKLRRSTCVTTAISLEQTTSPPTAQASVGAIGSSCVSTSHAEPCPDSQALHPCCPQKCPLRKPLLDSALTVSQLQQMRPSVITCAPRRSCSEAPTSISPSQISSLEHCSSVIPGSSSSPQKRHHSWTTSLVGPSARLNREVSPKQRAEDKADKSLSPSP